jgi:prepilin-type N-terminal cleavage/methylation domain-containing protein
MRKKGFTLVELLVVIAIIAMLLAILMPALAKVKTLAYQMLCGTNLKGVANAILVYTQDNNEKYPVAGTSNPVWNATGSNPVGNLYGNSNNWAWDNPAKTGTNGPTGKATVSACLYLLVKYADVSPSSFVCKAAKQKKLNIATAQADTSEAGTWSGSNTGTRAKDATECWDFSNIPSRYCSYAYSYPWTVNSTNWSLTSASKSGVAVAGDLNPWLPVADTVAWSAGMKTGGTWNNRLTTNPTYESPQLIKGTTKEAFPSGNSNNHETQGQNLLFNDMHVEFSKQPNPDSAIQNDNVYTPFDSTQTTNEVAKRQNGIQPTTTTICPITKEDSYLVQW